jgi:hypothetical protein
MDKVKGAEMKGKKGKKKIKVFKLYAECWWFSFDKDGMLQLPYLYKTKAINSDTEIKVKVTIEEVK